MLTADLVDVRRTGRELELGRIDGKKRLRIVAIGKAVLDAVKAAEGKTRADVETELAAIDVGAREYKMKDALAKLVLDACEWDEHDAEKAEAVRQAIFVKATEARKNGTFDRAALVKEAGLPEDGELFPDLREAARIVKTPTWNAETLFGIWERARAQAILLRATKVRVAMRCASASQARALFRAIKFLGLLWTLRTLDDGSHLLEIDGPFSLFESVTKYGLKLALLVPLLDACEAYALEAEVRWGKERETLEFKMFGGSNAPVEDSQTEHGDLIQALKKLGLDARPSSTILTLPGVGMCIPDLDVSGVHVEILGFWSRDAVWKRVELVEKGLSPPIVFAVSARLRVSEDVLPDDAPAALYVYKGAISPKALAAKIQAVAR